MAGKTRKVVRDSGNGRFVPNGTEKRRPRTTEVERVPVRKAGKRK